MMDIKFLCKDYKEFYHFKCYVIDSIKYNKKCYVIWEAYQMLPIAH